MFIVYSPEGRQSLATNFQRPTRLRKISPPSSAGLNDTFLSQDSDSVGMSTSAILLFKLIAKRNHQADRVRWL